MCYSRKPGPTNDKPHTQRPTRSGATRKQATQQLKHLLLTQAPLDLSLQLVTSIRADARGFSSIKGHTCTVAFHLKLSVHTHVLYPVHYSSPFLGYSMFLHMHALLTLIILELCASCGADASPAQGRIELHVHLDGSIPPKALLHVAQHRNLSLPVVGIPKSIEDIWTSLRSIQEVWKRCAKAWIQKTSCAPYECFKHIMFVD